MKSKKIIISLMAVAIIASLLIGISVLVVNKKIEKKEEETKSYTEFRLTGYAIDSSNAYGDWKYCKIHRMDSGYIILQDKYENKEATILSWTIEAFYNNGIIQIPKVISTSDGQEYTVTKVYAGISPERMNALVGKYYDNYSPDRDKAFYSDENMSSSSAPVRNYMIPGGVKLYTGLSDGMMRFLYGKSNDDRYDEDTVYSILREKIKNVAVIIYANENNTLGESIISIENVSVGNMDTGIKEINYDIIISSEVYGKKVEIIKPYAFSSIPYLFYYKGGGHLIGLNIHLPNTITYIGEKAFARPHSLDHLIINDYYMENEEYKDYWNDVIIKSFPDQFYTTSEYQELLYIYGKNEMQNINQISRYGTGNNEIKNIDNYAFENYIGSINLGTFYNLEYLGEGAFKGCRYLFSDDNNKSNRFPKIVDIKPYTFQGTLLRHYSMINEKIESIGEYAFADTMLILGRNYATRESLIPDTVKYIGDYAFAYTAEYSRGEYSLFREYIYHPVHVNEYIKIPSNVTYIGRYIFANISSDYLFEYSLSVEIENGVTAIGDYAFAGIRSVGHRNEIVISIPKSVTHLGDACLEIDPNKLVIICDGDNSLAYMHALNYQNACICVNSNPKVLNHGPVEVSFNLESTRYKNDIGYYTNISGWENVSNDGEFIKATKSYDENTTEKIEINIANVVGYYTITVDNITKEHTYEAKTIDVGDYTIRASTCTISTSTGGICGQLNPDETTTEIVKYNGHDTKVEIPEKIANKTVTKIGAGAFAGNGTVTEIIIPDTVTRINVNAFQSCYNLTNINMPSNLTHIDASAFDSCTSLTKIEIPFSETNIVIGEGAFTDCTSLKYVTIPKNVTKIGDNAFAAYVSGRLRTYKKLNYFM